MKILVLTQKVDKEDPILGFFHNWLLEFSKKFEKVSVICLEKGVYNLSPNVKIYSLGKEKGRNKIKYVFKFFTYIIGLALEYDKVFVHMNQEYVLLGGIFWKILGKKIFLWRNHKYGNTLTRIAVLFSNKVFYTSDGSFTAKFKKGIKMPVGIDTQEFKVTKAQVERKNRILFLGRIAPIKRPDLLVETLNVLNKKGFDFESNFYGDALLKDKVYFEELKRKVKEYNLTEKVKFFVGVPNYKTPEIYNDHGIFVNLTSSGSFDKTILESAACGCIPIVVNKSLDPNMFSDLMAEENLENVVEKLEEWLAKDTSVIKEISKKLQNYTLENHSLSALIEQFYKIIFKL